MLDKKKIIKYEIDLRNVTLHKEMAEVVYDMFGRLASQNQQYICNASFSLGQKCVFKTCAEMSFGSSSII